MVREQRVCLGKAVQGLAAGQCVIACIGFGTLAFLVFRLINYIPNTYHEFVDSCNSGQIDIDLCQKIKDQALQICEQKWDIPSSEPYECWSRWDTVMPQLKQFFRVFCTIFVLVEVCCVSCICGCGFFGAKQDNKGLLYCFGVMQVLAIANFIFTARSSSWLMLALAILPAISLYFSCRLVSELNNGDVRQQPLTAGFPVAQPVRVQPHPVYNRPATPVQAQPVYPVAVQAIPVQTVQAMQAPTAPPSAPVQNHSVSTD
mmetsp:Transcript_83773/g.130695  ORF Transcript_83773/g.130695 Transcript_83773/m.130695 type:complete len:259 (+) Transcript_83773:70-846(+)